MTAAVHLFPLDCETALAGLRLLRDRLKAQVQKARDDDYVRRTPASANPRARRGSNWELYWILNVPVGGPQAPDRPQGPLGAPGEGANATQISLAEYLEALKKGGG